MARLREARTNGKVVARPGGQFLLDGCGDYRIFTPEMFSEDQLALAKTAGEFSDMEVAPRIREIEGKEPGVLVGLLKKAGELGFLMIDVPEKYGGLGLTTTASMLMTEALRRVGSFSVTLGAHTGIGTLPLVFYGTDAQKQKYLPRLASGEWIAAYALTEAGSGSDALAAKTTAILDGDHWVLNGVKQWITNGSFADLFTVFAQVDGAKFSAFLVERATPGVSIGPEEHKMGIRGSSTVEVILENVRVPRENLLGEIGRGHKIAFNILNVGRLKLGIGTIGGAKYALELAVQYAKERKQFGKAIAEFGLIRQKLGRMATAIFVGESMGYRTSGLIDAAMEGIPADAPDADFRHAQVIEEYAIEASILKIFGSETMDWVSDESLQIHGGYGFTEHYPIERLSRDSRINRIFEGTNEINRLLIPTMLLKRGAKGQLDLLRFARKAREMLRDVGNFASRPAAGPLGYELRMADAAKQVVGYVAGMAVEKLLPELADRQEILGALADCLIAAYGIDSAVARTQQAIELFGPEKTRTMQSMVRVFAHDAYEIVTDTARLLAEQMATPEEMEAVFTELGHFPDRHPIKYFSEIEAVAVQVLAADGYQRPG